MFDIGFTELVIIGIVSLLVIGPERLPGAIRTGSTWLRRIKRGFNDIKREVEQELHNDSVLQDLKKTGSELSNEVNSIGGEIRNVTDSLHQSNVEQSTDTSPIAPNIDSGKAPE
ncbi:MAG: Sec-independent protein translocase protein TatB [Halioglobus sp.]